MRACVPNQKVVHNLGIPEYLNNFVDTGRGHHARKLSNSFESQFVEVPFGLGDSALKRTTVALHTYIGVTQPLTEAQKAAVRGGCMVFDDRSNLNYFRPIDGGKRLLWGARAEAYVMCSSAISCTSVIYYLFIIIYFANSKLC